MPDRLDVVVFVEFVEHLFERFQLVLGKRDLILRDHGEFRFEERQPLLLKELARLGERGNGRVNFKRVLLRDNVVRACLDGVIGDLLLGEIGRAFEHDDALLVEHIGDAPRRAERSAVLAHDGAHVARGTVVVVGQRLDDDRRAAHAVSFVGKLLIISVSEFARRALDGALDIVVGHIRRLRLRDDVRELGVGGRIGVIARRNGDLSAEFREDLAAGGVRLALLRLNIVPFAMT